MKRKGAKSPADSLARYRTKRDFAATPEPSAGEPAIGDGQAQRFVIHEHSARRLHWDLRLERDGALASWALPKGLPEAPGANHFAAHTEDHPLEYLEFHGEIPKGQYGAGTITIWDRGTYECLKWEPRKVEVALHGERVDARYALFPIEQGEQAKDWMIHRIDPPADAEREPMPERVVPMLARSGTLPPDADGWAYEIKWDGVRAIAYSRPGELRLESRNLKDITASYPELARLNRALSSHGAVLDGEIVAFDERGRPSFATLQRRMHVSSPSQARRLVKDTPVTLLLFDLLWLDGHSLMTLSYAERRELLSAMKLAGESWQTPEHVVGDGAALLEASVAQGLEGIVAKRLDSPYEPGVRARSWVKVKSVGRQELVVGGWMPGKGKRKGSIGALLLGVYEADGALRFVGRVGSGFSERELGRLAKLLAPLERQGSPFTAGERPPRGAVFCDPRLVVEVEFAHWTQGGNLRAPVYRGLRDDKDASRVVREDATVGYPAGRPTAGRSAKSAGSRARGEPGAGAANASAGQRSGADALAKVDTSASAGQRSGADALAKVDASARAATVSVDGRELKLSNLDKVLYPRAGTAKRQVIDYYAAIAPQLLPHLAGRPLTVTRWPDGVEGKSFFQKQAPAHRLGWVRTVSLPAQGKSIDYVLADDEPTLVWLANLAAIELHVPLSRAEDMQRPMAVVFDLDPGAPANIVQCCRVATLLRGVFEGIGLRSYAKTSGSKGLQVYVPLNGDVTYARTKLFAKTVAELLEQAEPDLVISRMTRARRTGKVLIDWSQNDAKKTTVCAYSLRASERPTASTPVEWEEVEATRDSGDPASLTFGADEVLARVAERGDLFAPVLSVVQELPG